MASLCRVDPNTSPRNVTPQCCRAMFRTTAATLKIRRRWQNVRRRRPPLRGFSQAPLTPPFFFSDQQRIFQIRLQFWTAWEQVRQLWPIDQEVLVLFLLTGLITSVPPGSSSSNRRSGQLDTPSAPSSFNKNMYGAAVTSLGEEEVKLEYKLSRVAVWVFLVALVIGLVVGAFLLDAVKNAVVLVAVVALIVPAVVIIIWNFAYKKQGVLQFLTKYPDSELRGVVDGQYVKITGVVTCGSIPLETSFQKVPRCVCTLSELYEYRGCGGKPTNTKQRFFSWGCRHSEKYAADSYISDFKSGLRALVKAG